MIIRRPAFSLLALLLLLAFGLHAQDEQEQTLFKSIRVVGAFGSPIFELGNLYDSTGTSTGGGGALVFNKFFLGGFGMGSSGFASIDFQGTTYKIDMGYGGIWLGFTPLTHKAIHPYISTRYGWGKIKLNEEGASAPSYQDKIFCFIPEAGFEVNFFRWFRICASGGYRLVTGANDLPANSLELSDLRSFCGYLTLRFGGFGSN
ncbi:MAG: hypothetical protein H6563_12035 [Lewinellaceae bacterium]|nr:hypothetical protein [Lewinellaceae bacterium]